MVFTAPAQVVAPAAPPQPTNCRTFVPDHTDTLVVNQQEFATPEGLIVTNWAAADVAHKDRAGTGARPACRAAEDVTELIVHETASTRVNRGGTGRPNVHLVLHRDGTFTQHADLVHDLNHGNHHNRTSFGFETVNPVLPRIAGAPRNGLPANQVSWPTIQNTIWTGQDNFDPDRRRERDPATGNMVVVNGPLPRQIWNQDRNYVRPTDEQLEAATQLIIWATDDTVGHGMDIPQDWQGLRRSDELMLMGRDDALYAARSPGLYAHGYLHHSDGWFLVLYAWLRIAHGLNQTQALEDALDIAENHVIRHREPGGRRAPHAELSHAREPGGGPPGPGPGPGPQPGPEPQ